MRFALALAILAALQSGPARGELAGEQMLSLARALTLAEESSPRLAAAREALLAAEGEERQARAWPNPELEFEIENFGGSGPFGSRDAAEQTVSLSQTFEIGGKRASRRAAAAAARRLAELERDAELAALRADLARAYRRAQLAAERSGLAKAQSGLAAEVDATIRARVEAGKAARLESLGARAALASARAAAARAGRAWRASWAELASLVGLDPSDPQALEDPAALPSRLPSNQQLHELADAGPSQRALLVEAELLRAEARGASAERIPDPSVFAGFRRFEESGDSAWVAGVSIPLPLLDTRRGAVSAAEARARGQLRDAEETERARRAALAAALERLRASREEVDLLESEVIPAAEEAFELISIGYRQGKLTYLDVLEANRVLAQAQLQRIDVLAEGFRALGEIESRVESLLLPDREDRP